LKRIPELRDLSDDHHAALVIARRCRRADRVDAALWRSVREAFATHLEPHFGIEDRHLLRGLDAIGEARLADRIRDDHAALRELARELAPTVEHLQRFGELLAAHVRFEEREVFESTQARLPADALRAIAEECRSIPRSCPVFE
jgi:hypothetical protein